MDIRIERKSDGGTEPERAEPPGGSVVQHTSDAYRVKMRDGVIIVVCTQIEPIFRSPYIQVGDNWFHMNMVDAILGDGEEAR